MGYVGNLLRVNLTDNEVALEPLDLEIAAEYIGGRGYGVKLLWDELAPNVEPLSDGNKIVFMTGPLTGLAPASGRSCVVSRSPQTNTMFDSHVGGRWGVGLKAAGFDGVIVEGAAEGPVCIHIHDGKATIKATDLWGKSVTETIGALQKEGSVSCIGPAGEHKVRFASIMHDDYRAAGRGGLGAVMGAKNLKAITVKGKRKIAPVNPTAFKRYRDQFLGILKGHPTLDALGRFGTLLLMNPVNKHGILPARNFTEGIFERVHNITGETMRQYLVKQKGCATCPIVCGRVARVGATTTHGPEYESTWALGPQMGIGDPEIIAKANNECNDLGLDTISMGNTLGFAMECYERGLIKKGVKFGDSGALELIRKTAYREGLGDLLAEGTRRMSERVGGGEFAAQVKGLELPAYDPRGVVGQALAFATSNKGATHLGGYLVPEEVLSLPRYVDNLEKEGKVEMVKEIEDFFAAMDSLIMCKYTTLALFSTLKFEVDLYAQLLTTATGFYFDAPTLKRAGERIWNLERLYNCREGFDSKDDHLPSRFRDPIREGPAAGAVDHTDELLPAYYEGRGWNPNGVPGERKLRTLGLPPVHPYPILQVALDLRNLEEALKLAEGAVAGGVDWLEAGTPLIKSAGMEAVRQLRERFPWKTIVADLKTMDTGWLETEIAAQAGADIVGIAGAAGDHTIKDAVGASKRYGVQIMVDLISVRDPVKRAIELERMGVHCLEFHISIDEQLRSGDQKIPFPLVRRVVEAVSIPVAVAGGLRVDTVPLAIRSGAKIAVVGGGITRAASPEGATKAILRAMGR